ncbi:isopenicillin N synthase family dioxygenase [Tritonibacter litoralis]|nr:2-oxoglutarate and iron-dependent oxygenase domain-containing protein [Tritonibacter litoralis]
MTHDLAELRKETGIGATGVTIDRDVPVIDMSDFGTRRADITEELWQAATEIGFFQLKNHGIPQELIDTAFAQSAQLFAKPEATKAKMPLKPGTNAGWEYKAQVRPSTGTADQKESYQITLPRMAGLWPDTAEMPDFKASMLAFERHNWALAMRVLSCFADKLGVSPAVFIDGHDPLSDQYQSTLRLLHYLDMKDAKPEDFKFWRAGAHTDFDCLTLLHQRSGQGGLQVCPGKDSDGRVLGWTDVPPQDGIITCNIGDMLMRWSDDQLLSNLHRVRMPKEGESLDARYSIAYFAQANMDTVLQGPAQKYEPITAHDYIQMRLGANFAGKAG